MRRTVLSQQLTGSWLLPASLGVALVACDAPSGHVDASDLRGVFDRRASATATASSSTSLVLPAPTGNASPNEREAEVGCVAAKGSAAPNVVRTVGRPACRGAEVLEWRDASGAPRYGCVFAPPDLEKRSPIPLLVYFHGAELGLDDPSSVAKLTSLRGKMAKADLTGEPNHRGFIVLSIQGRAILGGTSGASFDLDYVSKENVDVATTDHFIDVLAARGVVDRKRTFTLGVGRGGTMAINYAMIRADRVAAAAAYAPAPPTAVWSCAGPPPPLVIYYRACDSVVACDLVEEWLGARAQADTIAVRLADDGRAETHCSPKNVCSPKKGRANHLRWPKARETELLERLSRHALK